MEIRHLVDTNRLTDFFRRDPAVVKFIEEAAEVFVPFIVLAEMEAGFLLGNPKIGPNNESMLLSFLQKPSVLALYPDRETTKVFAHLFAQVRAAGTPIPTNDLWIASLAVQHNLTLLTRDRHFDRIPQVSRI
jgi:tRNA(fMet)-specific endonuclease VapC